ncbi:MAG: nucleotidyl transferase AbiEii/AbiGii toxin family protein [Myxococcota bacterium]
MSSLDAAVDFWEGLMGGERPRGYWHTFEKLLKLLRRARARGTFAGALALTAHGIERMTKDIDLLVHPEDKAALLRHLSMELTLQEDLDTLVVFRDPETTVDVDILVPFDSISLAACSSPVPARVRGRRIRVVGANDLTAMKVIAAVDSPGAEAKQRADVEALVRQGRIDVNHVSRLLADEAGADYARYFMERVRHVQAHPARVPPRRRSLR